MRVETYYTLDEALEEIRLQRTKRLFKTITYLRRLLPSLGLFLLAIAFIWITGECAMALLLSIFALANLPEREVEADD